MTTPPPDRRHFQFSLRGLLIFISLLAVSFSCFHDAYVTDALPHALALFLGCFCIFVVIAYPLTRTLSIQRRCLIAMVFGILFLFLVPMQSGHWDGRFALSIAIQSKSSQPIAAATYHLEQSKKEFAEDIASNPTITYWENFKQFQKEAIYLAEVPCYGRFDLIGYYGYGEFRYIVVLVKYSDGTQACVAAEIPKGRGNRSMTIEVP